MRLVVIGLGVQGRKRAAVAGADLVATVDPVLPAATHSRVEDVPLGSFDAACVCTPDDAKIGIVTFLLSHGKHVLVEKPLLGSHEAALQHLREVRRAAGVACYTAYNHRFEPHLVRLRELLASDTLGEIYVARFFYGNGTARDVAESPWRDRGLGVLADLGSHVLDLSLFLFGPRLDAPRLWHGGTFENAALDHVTFGAGGRPAFEFGVSLLWWRNTFTVDIVGMRGSAHVDGLCKWGPSTLRLRRRVLPSGEPAEEMETAEGPDPTWAAEYRHFEDLCRVGGTNIDNDLWIQRALNAVVATSAESVRA